MYSWLAGTVDRILLAPNVTHQARPLPTAPALSAACVVGPALFDHLSAMRRIHAAPMQLSPRRKVVKHNSVAPAFKLAVEVSHE